MPGYPLVFHQTLSTLHIIGGSCMVKRFHREALVLIPDASTDVQFIYLALRVCWREGDALVESKPEQISKEMVIAVPPPFVVQGDDEQVGAFEIYTCGFPNPRGGWQNGNNKGAHKDAKDG